MTGHTYGEEAPVYKCPYCATPCDADFVDVGVGMIQCGPYHCVNCQASEIGPHDEYFNPFKPLNSPDEAKMVPVTPKEGVRVLTQRESETGWYAPHTVPGTSANVIHGNVVSHRVMKEAYQAEFRGNPDWHDKQTVDDWWKEIRE